MIDGSLDAAVAGRKKRVGAGDVIHVPRGDAYRWVVTGKGAARYAQVRSLPRLEAAIDKHGAADHWRG